MTRSDDLTGLFLPGDPSIPFRQGVVVSFNGVTGANVIDVGGAQLSDLPILNIGDTVNLTPGDTVILMKYGNSWAVLGRVVTVGSPDFAVATVATETKEAFASGFPVLITDEIVATTSNFTVPVWANRVDITVIVTVMAKNSTGSLGILYAHAHAGNNISQELFVSAPSGQYAALTVPNVDTDLGAIGGTTFTCAVDVSTDATTGNWASDPTNKVKLSATAIYTRV